MYIRSHLRCPQANWINSIQGITFHICKPIPPPRQSNRIPLGIPSCPRIVRAEVVVVQPALCVKVLPRVAQVEAHGRDVGAARRGVGGFVGEPLCPQRGGFIPVGAVGPLPGGLPVCLRQAPGGTQVVGVDGVQAAVDVCGNRDRPLGCGQVQVLALPCALASAHAVFAQEAAFFVVHIGPAQVFGFALGGVPQLGEEVAQGLQQAGGFRVFFFVQGTVLAAGCGVQGLGLEDALAQGVVGIAGGGGVRALAGLAALQATLAVVVVVVQAVALQIACGVVLVGDAGAGAVGGLLEAQEFVVAAFCAVAAGGGGGSGAFAGVAPGAAQRAGDASRLEAELGSGA